MTARGGAEAVATGLDAGADDYLAKPFAAEELRARTRAALRVSRLQEQELRTKARQAATATFAAGLLHNLGNVLNSVSVSSSMLEEQVRTLRVASVHKLAQLLADDSDELAASMAADERGTQLRLFASRLAEHLEQQRGAIADEVVELQQRLEHVKSIVALHRDIAKPVAVEEPLSPIDAMETALRLSLPSIEPRVRIERSFDEVPSLLTDKHKVLQILINLITNAGQAFDVPAQRDNVLTVGAHRRDDSVCFVVADNGMGMARDTQNKLFSVGFTTKPRGQGLGLHTSALLARELGGSLSCSSDGPGCGARVLELPLAQGRAEACGQYDCVSAP